MDIGRFVEFLHLGDHMFSAWTSSIPNSDEDIAVQCDISVAT